MKVLSSAFCLALLIGCCNMAAAQPPAWEVKADIKANDPDPGMGWSIGVSGDTLISGSDGDVHSYWNATLDDWVTVHTPGLARVFVRTSSGSNTGWEQQGDPLIVDDGEGGTYSWYRVAIDGDTAAVCAIRDETGDGRLFIFERNSSVWNQIAMLHSNLGGGSLRLALDGDIAVLGRPWGSGDWNDDTQKQDYHGEVFVYTRTNGLWADVPQVLTASDKVDGDYFGDAVAVSNDRILVGASEGRGKAYMFVNNGGIWEQEGDPLEPDEEATDPKFHFGAYVALDGDTALVGHDAENAEWIPGDEWLYSNLIVYGYSRSSGTWELSVKLTPASLGEYYDDYYVGSEFGRGVALHGNRALVEGDGRSAILFENWQYIKMTERPPGGLLGGIKPNRLALSSDTVFLGASHNFISYEGRIYVIDNFSVLPFVGPESIEAQLNIVGVLPTPFGALFYGGFITGYGQDLVFELLQKDCVEHIADTPFIDSYFENPLKHRVNMTSTLYQFDYITQLELIESSSVYNARTGAIEFCAVARLKNSSVRWQKQFEVEFKTLSDDDIGTTASASTTKFSDPFWYPAWGKGSSDSVCYNDGNAPIHMKMSGLFFESSREACCERFFRWDRVACLGETTATPPGFYPNWGHSDDKCLNSTAMIGHENSLPDYMMKSPQQWIYPDIESCCNKYYSWDVHNCILKSGGTSELSTPQGFYPNWGFLEDKCLNSTAQIGQENSLPDYMMKNPQQWLYDDIESCCKKYYFWDVNNCIVKSGGTVEIEYSNKWYVNEDKELCQQDCIEDPTSPTCGGAVESWNALYDTPESCCAYKLFWVSSGKCVQKSLVQQVTGSEKWYVDWVLQKCVKDCEGGTNCGGLAASYNNLYDYVDDCCGMLFWKDSSECI